jgi:hypothetical protein
LHHIYLLQGQRREGVISRIKRPRASLVMLERNRRILLIAKIMGFNMFTRNKEEEN